MTQVSIGPGLSPEAEFDLQRTQRAVALTETEKSADAVEEKIAGMQRTLDDRRAEIALLRAELED